MESFEQLREFQDIVCTRYLTAKATLQMLEQADTLATSTLVDGNCMEKVIAAAEVGGKRKRKNEEQDEENKHYLHPLHLCMSLQMHLNRRIKHQPQIVDI